LMLAELVNIRLIGVLSVWSDLESGFASANDLSLSQVSNNTTFRLENLLHFAQYTIQVQACLDPDPTDPKGKKYCSMLKAVTSARTKPRGTRSWHSKSFPFCPAAQHHFD
jgi:hypothetical protein